MTTDRYALLTSTQRVAGALWSLITAMSHGGYDVHGGVATSALARDDDQTVAEILWTEGLDALTALAAHRRAPRTTTAAVLADDFRVAPPTDTDTPAMLTYLGLAATYADTAAKAMLYTTDHPPQAFWSRVPTPLYQPWTGPAALSTARLALRATTTPADAPGHLPERLLYATAEIVDRTVRLRLPAASAHKRRAAADRIIRLAFDRLHLPRPDAPDLGP